MRPSPSIAGNLAWNLAGEIAPALTALVAIPILLHRLGAERFGVLTISWMTAGYFGLFDLGLGRALTQAMAQDWSRRNGRGAAALFWTAFAMMLALGAVAAILLAMIAPYLARDVLRIPPALQDETRLGFYLIAGGLPMLISTSALRGALTAGERFDLLNLIRTPVGIVSFAAPVLMLPFTRNLAWLIGVLMLNRAMSWLIYLVAVLRVFPEVRAHRALNRNCVRPLLGFGIWVTISAVIAPILLYLDRFLIGGLMSLEALTAYAVPMEIVSKSFIFPAAVAGVMFPAFARALANGDTIGIDLFARAVKLTGLALCPMCAAAVTFAPQIMALWIDRRFSAQSSRVLQILAGGAFVTGLAWIPLALLHGARRPDLPALLHLADAPLYALLLAIGIPRFGLSGAAFIWSGRLLLENLIIFAMASRFLKVPARTAMRAGVAFASALTLVTAGAVINDLYLKAIFVALVMMVSAVATWRFLLEESNVAAQLGSIFSAAFASAYQRTAD